MTYLPHLNHEIIPSKVQQNLVCSVLRSSKYRSLVIKMSLFFMIKFVITFLNRINLLFVSLTVSLSLFQRSSTHIFIYIKHVQPCHAQLIMPNLPRPTHLPWPIHHAQLTMAISACPTHHGQLSMPNLPQPTHHTQLAMTNSSRPTRHDQLIMPKSP